MRQYRKKPVVIEAAQFRGPDNVYELVRWINENGVQADAARAGGAFFIYIPTLEGQMRADVGDWIIKGVKGEFYPCKPDVFDATYEPEPVDRECSA